MSVRHHLAVLGASPCLRRRLIAAAAAARQTPSAAAGAAARPTSRRRRRAADVNDDVAAAAQLSGAAAGHPAHHRRLPDHAEHQPLPDLPRRQYTEQSQAPMISVTHFMDRDGQVLAAVSPRRYFCTQCHVAQTEAQPLVANTFQDIDSCSSRRVETRGCRAMS